jgi:hypothetical protein
MNPRKSIRVTLPDTLAMREVLHYLAERVALDESEFHSGEGRVLLGEAWRQLATELERSTQ